MRALWSMLDGKDPVHTRRVGMHSGNQWQRPRQKMGTRRRPSGSRHLLAAARRGMCHCNSRGRARQADVNDDNHGSACGNWMRRHDETGTRGASAVLQVWTKPILQQPNRNTRLRYARGANRRGPGGWRTLTLNRSCSLESNGRRPALVLLIGVSRPLPPHRAKGI
jgi:hypothetical protein